ncbi:MAG: glycine--tRNA ligase subunit beta [Burkholderiaceae bacterium]|nr:glycine--tRNA ligase subunit beta [Burkholderiaceae bacterium]MDH3460889.1 glycine--tRNA ligase subunit beta [Burkholderiaceae bacterium]
MATKNLLVELLVEELPPKALKTLGASFAHALLENLQAHGLASEHSAVTAFATPRRLGAHVSTVRNQADKRAVSQKLMPVSVGLDAQGQATAALLKKLTSLGIDVSVLPQLKRQMDGKSEALYFDSVVAGATLAEGLQKSIDETLARLPIPKVMQYQLEDGWTSVNFVRPAHSLVALWGAEVVPVQALGLHAGRHTQGHRFAAAINPVVLQDADHYERQMQEQGAVIASFSARHGEIARQLSAAAPQGLEPIDDASLLDEVTALVERPHVLLCRFDPEFLAVPQECLVLTMKANQKYFPLVDADGKLTNKFLVVSNIQPDDASRVVSGNERVVRPRLADAKFFFDKDRQIPLKDRVDGLDKVVYHAKLGTMGQRVQRVRSIAQAIGRQLGGDTLAAQSDHAAMLAKADLLTDMVGEFPELQGTMGRYYALHDGETNEVADAIEDHYKPRFAGDTLPRGEIGVVLALADKLEILVGLFSVGQAPTGDKDPFALRRHALGLIRVLIERDLPFKVEHLVGETVGIFDRRGLAATGSLTAVTEFVYGRLAASLRDQGYSAQEVEAVLARRDDLPFKETFKRIEAVRVFSQMPESASLAAANKRVQNILNKTEGAWGHSVDVARFEQPAEQALHDALLYVDQRAQAALGRGDYTESLQELTALKAPVDTFFDSVMVNVEDNAMRANRLGLLALLHGAMNRVADLSKLAT